MSAVTWQWQYFDDLSAHQVYELMRVRQDVFVIEQQCLYRDLDALDRHAWHLCAWGPQPASAPELWAYLRVLPPGLQYPQASIGRVLTAAQARRCGYGQQMLTRAIEFIGTQFPQSAIRIAAQTYLLAFYQSFGFVPMGAVYDDEGIEHVDMLRSPE